MNEDIIRMAMKADKYANMQWPNPKHKEHWQLCRDTHFANLIRADEREACAKICEEEYDTGLLMAPESPSLAARIRARGEK